MNNYIIKPIEIPEELKIRIIESKTCSDRNDDLLSDIDSFLEKIDLKHAMLYTSLSIFYEDVFSEENLNKRVEDIINDNNLLEQKGELEKQVLLSLINAERSILSTYHYLNIDYLEESLKESSLSK